MKNPYTDTFPQEKLYRKHLLPNEQRLLEAIQEVRSDVDAFFTEKQQISPRVQQSLGIQDIHKYPRGHCYEIASKVREGLLEIAPDFFKEFLDEGGLCERNWGFFVQNGGGRIFHNTIQIGTRVYDVCHEEPSGTDRKFHITHISDPRYRLIDSYQNYAEVREKYHHCKAHSIEGVLNIVFIPVIPLIFVLADGRLIIGDEQVIVKRNVHTNFRFGKDFLKDGVQGYPRLPEYTRKNLEYCFEENIRYATGVERKYIIECGLRTMFDKTLGFSHANIRKGIKEWHKFDDHFKVHGTDIYHGAKVVITLLRRVLNTYNSLLLKGKLPFGNEKNGQIP